MNKYDLVERFNPKRITILSVDIYRGIFYFENSYYTGQMDFKYQGYNQQ